MLQELFRIPYFDIPVFGYGLMMVIGFFFAMTLARYLAKRYGIDPEIFANAGLLALVTGIAGARISHILENLSTFTDPSRTVAQNVWAMVNIRSGGLTYYGGFLLAFPSLVLYAIHKKVPLRLGMDIIAPCLMIGLGFGRVGCFLNGCCYGAECHLPWAVHFPYNSYAYQEEYDRGIIAPPEQLIDRTGPGQRLLLPSEIKHDPELMALAAQQHSNWVHPAQLYSAFTALLIAALCVAYFTLPHVPGRVFALMMIFEGSTRFLLEILRSEPAVIGRFSLSMIIGLLVFAGGIALWLGFDLFAPKKRAGFPLAAVST